jgi:glutamine---fructose-6-phosphate transaminase (isomerizing)
MIAAQPATLRAVAGLDVNAAVQCLRPARRVYIVGTGTSHHAAQLGAYLLRGGGLDAQAVPSSEFARWRPALAGGDGVVVISHTGETAYALAARAQALKAGVPLVTITGPQSVWPEAIETPIREQSETYTVSYTAALAVLGLLAHALAGTQTGAEALELAAGAAQDTIAAPGIAEIQVPERALALVGPGIWGVTAREGALKIRESAQILAEGFDSELLLHGAAVPYGAKDTLLALAPEADADGLTAGLLTAAAREGMKTHELSTAATDGSAAAVFLAQIPATVRLQLLAAQLTEARGTDPDHAITGAWATPELWSAGVPAA